MTHLVSVSQLQAQTGKSFLNVEGGSDTIGVSGNCFTCPTYLVTKNELFYFQQFDNQKVADEWLKHFGEEWKITKLYRWLNNEKRGVDRMSKELELYIEMCNALRSIDRIIKAELDWGNYDETVIRKAYNKLNWARVIMYHDLSNDDTAA